MSDRLVRLSQARLYLVCGEQPDAFLEAALRGGVDIVQLRMKDAPDDAILAAGRRFAAVCADRGVLFILNDRPDLVAAAGADGVHVGQDDVALDRARELVGGDRLVGLSTHSREQIERAAAASPSQPAFDGPSRQPDYIGVGPVQATPTKPGRPAVGLELVRYAAVHAPMPFFAIGGIDRVNASTVRAAGAGRIAVVRALTESADPESTARGLRAALGAAPRADTVVRVGSA